MANTPLQQGFEFFWRGQEECFETIRILLKTVFRISPEKQRNGGQKLIMDFSSNYRMIFINVAHFDTTTVFFERRASVELKFGCKTFDQQTFEILNHRGL